MARLSLALLLLSSFTVRAEAEACPPGQSLGADTSGHCCWTGQVWSVSRSACIGIPTQCPAGQRAEGEACIPDCPAGQSPGPDTQGQCCWPEQVWSSSRKTCIGIPRCQPPLQVDGERCVAAVPVAPPPVAPPPVAPVAPVAGGAAKVSFKIAGEGREPTYTATLVDERGQRVSRCKAPCTVDVPPKTYTLHVRGDGRYNGALELPGPAEVTLRFKEVLWPVVVMSIPAGIGMVCTILGAEAIGKGEATPLAWTGVIGGASVFSASVLGFILIHLKIDSVDVSVAPLPGGAAVGGALRF